VVWDRSGSGAVVVVVFWHTDCAGRGGDGCWKRKEGEQPIANQKFIICGYLLVEERYTQRDPINTIPAGFLILKMRYLKNNTGSHRFKASLVEVQHFPSHKQLK
jgi:hypothetical protein